MRKLQSVLMVLAILCFAVPAFADGGSAPINLAPIGIGLGIALAAGLCGLGQGKAVGSAVESVARNPGATASIQLLLILGLAFIESLTLFTFATIFIKIK
jgi:F-type H+-transporting ATPase subunit c